MIVVDFSHMEQQIRRDHEIRVIHQYSWLNCWG
jgi:hypothetical protein